MRAPVGTIRIYKIAEVLGIPSQEVVQLLRTQHGIEVKSASSTVEEIVARQFAERVARKRNVTLPAGSLFSQRPVAKRGGTRGGPAPEAVAPATPKLGPPRLVKSAKAARAAAEAATAGGAEPAAATPEAPAAEATPPPAAAPVSPPATAQTAAGPATSPGASPVAPRILPSTPRLRVEGAPRLRVETPRIRVEEPPATVEKTRARQSTRRA